jgi:hypothetical protein
VAASIRPRRGQHVLVVAVLPLHQLSNEGEQAVAALLAQGKTIPVRRQRVWRRQLVDPRKLRGRHARLVGVVDDRGEQHRAAGCERLARPPEVQRRGVAVTDRLLARRFGVDGFEWQRDLDQLLAHRPVLFRLDRRPTP